MQMVVYSGATGGGSMASDDLYLLDMRNGENNAQWMIVPVVGSTPGRRYGHTIVFSKPYLLVFGGNTGAEPVNDVWCLSVEKAPFSWIKLDCGKDQPPPRVYHSSALCMTGSATGMMVSFGGRTSNQSSLADTWGLRRHRDGRWDWVKAPHKTEMAPTPRYQHNTLFLGPLMIVIGGRTNTVGEDVPMEVYDTESSEWYKFNTIQRFRHFCW
jgi:protein phosphatase